MMTQARTHRRLAAILASDVVGYSVHMGQDETATRARFNHLDRVIFRPALDRHNGRLVKTLGDGALVEFASVIDAITCAVDLQRDIAADNAANPEARQLVFRIGINLGDIIVEDDDIHGDGVNVAARLEGLADPGGICISQAAHDQVRDKMDLTFADLGEVEVKNINRPIHAFQVISGTAPAPRAPQPRFRPRLLAAAIAAIAITGAGLLWWSPWSHRQTPGLTADTRLALPDKPSVAVLPFLTPGAAEDGELFADSVARDITSYLGQVSGLFVISASSTFTYKGSATPPVDIARDLGVRNIVQGIVRSAPADLSVSIEMIDGASGATIWSQEFDNTSGDTFALKEDIARSIARELAINISRASTPTRTTDSEAAYMFWYRASRVLNQAPDPETFAFARAMAESALAIDPGFGRAKAAMAYVATQMGYFGFATDRAAALQQGLALAQEAVALAPDDWYVHEMHGFTLMNLRDYEASVEAFDRGLYLAPANASTLVRSALPLLFLGRAKEAERRLDTAMRINPIYNWAAANFLAMAYYEQERYAEAVVRFDEAARLNPNFIGNMVWRAAAHAQVGNDETAREIAAALLVKAPKWTISNNFVKISDPATMERLNDGLRKAGLPE